MPTIDIRVKIDIPDDVYSSDDIEIALGSIYTDENDEPVLELTAVPSIADAN